MINVLINCLIVLGIIVTIYSIATAFLLGGVVLASIIEKIINICKGNKNERV